MARDHWILAVGLYLPNGCCVKWRQHSPYHMANLCCRMNFHTTFTGHQGCLVTVWAPCGVNESGSSSALCSCCMQQMPNRGCFKHISERCQSPIILSLMEWGAERQEASACMEKWGERKLTLHRNKMWGYDDMWVLQVWSFRHVSCCILAQCAETKMDPRVGPKYTWNNHHGEVNPVWVSSMPGCKTNTRAFCVRYLDLHDRWWMVGYE